ncbi:hypothetical protein C9374_001632 [Naegleria lovaniensis]|uniref:Protein kinase domain-containing protein n=1 Tax=Naegleria lovaniensis TaxID=51637 RepID=A0AA88GUS7_NAELO|nr:uncharacterized protein C9374_001632 [Naegleria lovaniensis]KAG2387300.1 hypothetical protein C9374_001632 [Naegleria lovaniensis]
MSRWLPVVFIVALVVLCKFFLLELYFYQQQQQDQPVNVDPNRSNTNNHQLVVASRSTNSNFKFRSTAKVETFAQNTIYGLSSKNYFSFPFTYGYWKFEFQTSVPGYVISYLPTSNLPLFNSTKNQAMLSVIDVGTTDYTKTDYMFGLYDTAYSFVLFNPLDRPVEFTKLSILQLYRLMTFNQPKSYSTPSLLTDYYFCPNCLSSDSSIDFNTDSFGLVISAQPGGTLQYLDAFIGVNKKASPNGNYDLQRRVTFKPESTTSTIPLDNANYPLASIYVSVVMSGCTGVCSYSLQIVRTSRKSAFDTTGLAVGMVCIGVCLIGTCVGIVMMLILYACYITKDSSHPKKENLKHIPAPSVKETAKYSPVVVESDAVGAISSNNAISFQTVSEDGDLKDQQQNGMATQPMNNQHWKSTNISPHIEDKIISLKSSFLQKSLRSSTRLSSVKSSPKLKPNPTYLTPGDTPTDGMRLSVASNSDMFYVERIRRDSEVGLDYIVPTNIDTYKSASDYNLGTRGSIDDTNDSNNDTGNGRFYNENRLKDRYHVEKLLGRGSFATVYLALDEKTNLHVAVKSIHIDDYRDENLVGSVREEGLRLTECMHPHIITITDVFPCTILQSVCFVMHYYKFGDLKTFIERNPDFVFTKKIMVSIIQQLSNALFYLHEVKSIIHNDLKPSNIFLDEIDRTREWVHVAIGDFGESTKYSPTSLLHFRTQSNAPTMKGTLVYLAPEIICGKGDLSHASDIWSFGCTVYQIITGDFKTQLSSWFIKDGVPNVLLEQAAHERIKNNMKQARPQYDDYLFDLVLQMLKCQPNERSRAFDIRHWCQDL